MSEPRRLRELSTSDLERSLLDAGAAYRCSPELREKTLSALGVAGAATITTSAAAASTPSIFGNASWAKVMLSISLVGAGAAVPVAYYVSQRKAAVTVVSPPPLARVVAPRALTEPVPVPAPTSEPSAEAAARDTSATTTTTTSAPKLSARSDTRGAGASAALTAELGPLDAARAALARGDADAALGHLDSYSRTFPRGRLALEAEVLRIDALAKAGRAAAARQRAENFLNRHPNSVLASRVRGYLSH